MSLSDFVKKLSGCTCRCRINTSMYIYLLWEMYIHVDVGLIPVCTFIFFGK